MPCPRGLTICRQHYLGQVWSPATGHLGRCVSPHLPGRPSQAGPLSSLGDLDLGQGLRGGGVGSKKERRGKREK